MPPSHKCTICFESTSNKRPREVSDARQEVTPCGKHFYHEGCYIKWKGMDYFNSGCCICDRRPAFSLKETKHCPNPKCGILIEKGPGCQWMECKCGKGFRWTDAVPISTLRNGKIRM